MVQKRKTAAMAIASAVTLNDGDIVKEGSMYRKEDSRSNSKQWHDPPLPMVGPCWRDGHVYNDVCD
jgi:hypothetical protein